MLKRLFILFLCMTMIVSLLPVQATAAQTVREEGFRDSIDTSYLKISMEKYGEQINASSLSETKDVTVLEYTKWQLKAMFVQIYEGKIIEQKDVTSECTWSSSDSSGKTLAVSANGVVTVYGAAADPCTVTATYEGMVPESGDNATVLVPQTFSAGFRFKIMKLKISAADAEAMRCFAFTYLANYEWTSLSGEHGMTVAQWVDQIERGRLGDDVSIGDVHHDITLSNIHLKSHDSYENSATVLHFLSAAAGSAAIEVCTDSYDGKIRAASFLHEGQRYIAYAYANLEADALLAEHFAAKENNGTRRYELLSNHSYATDEDHFSQSYSMYKAIVGNETAKVVGQYYGGIAAKYVSYVTGCDSFTFHAPSPIQYVLLKNFTELCQYYSVNKQTNYNFSEYDYTSTLYAIEPGYRVYRQFNNITAFGMLQYDTKEMTLSISKSVQNIERVHNLWNRRVYLGTDGNDTYSDDYSAVKMVESVMFGGEGEDTLTVKYGQKAGIDFVMNITNVCEWAELLMGDSSTLPTKAKWIKGLKQNVPGLIIDALMHSIIDHNYVISGPEDDLIRGSIWNNVFCYTRGSGNDTYYLYGLGNRFFLHGYGNEKASIKYSFSEDNQKAFISINDSDRFVIDQSKSSMTLGRIEFYQQEFMGKFFSSPICTISFPDSSAKAKGSCHRISCPVDVLIYNSEGLMVHQLLDGVESSIATEYGIFDVTLKDGEYVKTVMLWDDSYDIRLRGVGNGVMKYSMVLMGDGDGTDGQYCSVQDIPVTKGAIYHTSMDLDTALLTVDSNGDGTVDDTIVFDTTISFPQENMELAFGKQIQLAPEITTSSTDRSCYWISTDDTVASVDDNGLLTARGVGKTTIYAMVADGSGAMDSVTVTVPQPELSAKLFTVTGLEKTYPYTGNAIPVQLEVSYGCIPLVQGVHYEAAFSQLVEPGKAKLTITGINDYSGTLVLEYEILAPEEPDTVEEKVDWIAKQCRDSGITDEWEIALWLHDWLIYNADYDTTYTYYHPNGVLLEGTGVCQSYTEAYALLLQEFGIENRMITSQEMDHAWNLVKLDEYWCHIDCTWDDPVGGGAENHRYFGLNDDLISRDHVWPASNLPKAASLVNSYILRTEANVVRNPDELNTLLSTLAQEQTETFQCYYIGSDPEFSLYDEFHSWCAEYDWKYGLALYAAYGDDWMINASVIYTDPWDPPEDLTEGLDCFDFTLRGPDGVYPIRNYSNNAMILIFGSAYNSDTQTLLTLMNSKAKALRAKGVLPVVNLNYTEKPSDFDDVKAEYANLTFTYADEILQDDLLKLAPRDSGWYVYEPIVFVFNGKGQITYYHSGYLSDLTDLLTAADLVATGNPLPEPEPADDNYVGSIFSYNGDRAALAAMIDQQLRQCKPHILVKDGTWNSSQGRWDDEILGSLVMEILEPYRKNTHLYTIPEYWDYYSEGKQIQVDIVYAENATRHFMEHQEAVEPTCTSYGLTEGLYCKICGLVLKEQMYVYPTDHVTEPIGETPATCTENGSVESRCTLCGTTLHSTVPALGHRYKDALDTTCDFCSFVREVQPIEPLADVGYFTLRGPDGVYPTSHYDDNGILLIFGSSGCWYTRNLLSQLNSRTEALAQRGVQTFVNEGYSDVSADLEGLRNSYPNFTFTYRDDYLLNKLRTLVGETSGSFTYPLVFVLDKDSRILYFSSGPVNDVNALVEIAAVTATDHPLPTPEPVDGRYIGSAIRYTGDNQALLECMQQELSYRNMYVAVRDGRQNISQNNWNPQTLATAMIDCFDKCPSCANPFVMPDRYSMFYNDLQIQMDITYLDASVAAHTPQVIPGTAATCTQPGLSEGSRCSACGMVLREQEEIPAAGHKEVTAIAGYDATCLQSGLTDKKQCSSCGTVTQKQTVIPAAGHQKETVPGTPPTCTETGLSEGIRCNVCNLTFVKQEILPVMGHLWDEGTVSAAPTDDVAGERLLTCTVCAETKTEMLPPLSHTHNYTETVTNPTCTQQGFTTRSCECGHSYADNYLPALGHSYSGGICSICADSYDTDINGDGTLDEGDAVYLLWHTLFPKMYPVDVDADLDGNGSITSNDALQLLWLTLFPG